MADCCGTAKLCKAGCVNHQPTDPPSFAQSSGALQASWFPERLSGPAAKVCHDSFLSVLMALHLCTLWMLMQVLQGSLPEEYQELREPSVPDLSYVLGQVCQMPSGFGLVLRTIAAHHHQLVEHCSLWSWHHAIYMMFTASGTSCKTSIQVKMETAP